LHPLQLDSEEIEYAKQWVASARPRHDALREQALQNCRLQLDQNRARRTRLTDAFLDGNIDKDLFEERKASLLLDVGLTNATVGKWRRRFLEQEVSGLHDELRPGRSHPELLAENADNFEWMPVPYGTVTGQRHDDLECDRCRKCLDTLIVEFSDGRHPQDLCRECRDELAGRYYFPSCRRFRRKHVF
jgi:hypothetical protein